MAAVVLVVGWTTNHTSEFGAEVPVVVPLVLAAEVALAEVADVAAVAEAEVPEEVALAEVEFAELVAVAEVPAVLDVPDVLPPRVK